MLKEFQDVPLSLQLVSLRVLNNRLAVQALNDLVLRVAEALQLRVYQFLTVYKLDRTDAAVHVERGSVVGAHLNG